MRDHEPSLVAPKPFRPVSSAKGAFLTPAWGNAPGSTDRKFQGKCAEDSARYSQPDSQLHGQAMWPITRSFAIPDERLHPVEATWPLLRLYVGRTACQRGRAGAAYLASYSAS